VEWLNTKETTASELVEVCLKQQKRTKNFNAYITVTEDRARRKGKEIDNDSMAQYSSNE
jgi:Asp-tRNA(Asn)/Glu-tRNA(Gln) amidotransferase A subunit family amidase